MGPWRALIVEDEALVAFLLEDILEEIGFVDSTVASRLREGLRLAREGAFDVAFLDVNLGDGERSFAIAEQLSKRGIPFAFVTGYDRASLDGRFVDSPVLRKPFRKEDIQAFLDRLDG